MTVVAADALVEVLDYLRGISQDSTPPPAARTRLRLLQQRYPDLSMELVWESEAYDESIHYDVLLRTDGHGTTSLSYCPDRVQPWPLRGVHRWSEQDLLRVNTTMLSVGQAVACLDFIWEQASIVDRLVNVCLIQEELERDPIELSDADLQHAMDGFRRARRLLTAADTVAWMQRRGISHPELEAMVADQVLVARLRRRIAGPDVAAYFAAHHAEFDGAQLARVVFQNAQSVPDAVDQARAGFFEAAQQWFVDGTAARVECVAVDRLHERRLAEAALATTPGAVLGPLDIDGQPILALVLAHTRGQLDAPTSDRIEHLLFDRWLDARRAAAEIEWNWSNVARTSPAEAA